MKTITVLLLVTLSGCASHPMLRNAGIALGVALVAGSTHDSGHVQSSPQTDMRVPGVPCASDPKICQ